MAYQERPNTGTLFPNPKQKETHPDLKGKINIDGVIYYVSAWSKQGGKGEFFSLAITKADQKPQGNATPPSDDTLSDLPF